MQQQQRGTSVAPLGDLRVIELAGEAGEWCGKLMGDLGADVIKIEPPGGAAEREIGPFYQDVPHPDRSLHFWHYNTSKRGVTLDLEPEDGRALFRQLVTTADVLIETYAPGYLSSLGLGYEQLRTLNPGLVMCSLTPFGQNGPWRDYRSSDLIHLAAGGQMGACGYSEADLPDAPPIAPGGGNAWHTGSHYAYIAIMSAIFCRGIAGEGQYIDCAVHDALALTTEYGVVNWIYDHRINRRQTGRHASAQVTAQTQYRCADGRYVNTLSFGMRMSPRQVATLAEWFDAHGLAQDLKDPKYAEQPVVNDNLGHIREVAANFIAHMPSEEVYHGAQQRGIPLGPIRAPEEVVADEHFRDRGFWEEVEHPELGRAITYPGAPAIFGASPSRISRRAPLVGEHNREIYGELGVTPERQALLREWGVI